MTVPFKEFLDLSHWWAYVFRMDIFDFAVAAFAGNLLTVWFLWGCYRASKAQKDEETSWPALAALGFPLIILILAFLSTGPVLPYLDALSPQ